MSNYKNTQCKLGSNVTKHLNTYPDKTELKDMTGLVKKILALGLQRPRAPPVTKPSTPGAFSSVQHLPPGACELPANSNDTAGKNNSTGRNSNQVSN